MPASNVIYNTTCNYFVLFVYPWNEQPFLHQQKKDLNWKYLNKISFEFPCKPVRMVAVSTIVFIFYEHTSEPLEVE